MTSTNKKGAGFILSLLTVIAGVVGLVFCMVNANMTLSVQSAPVRLSLPAL